MINKTKAIVVLANNMFLFENILRNYPEELYNYSLIVFTELRIKKAGHRDGELEPDEKVRIIHELIEKYGLKENAKVITSETVNKKFVDDVFEVYSAGEVPLFFEEYTMSMNILMPWFVFKYVKKIEKILMIDEDVIFNKGAHKVFEFDECQFHYFNLNAGGFWPVNERQLKTITMWYDFFDIPHKEKLLTEDEYKWYQKRYVNGSQMLLIKDVFDVDKFEKYLEKFFFDQYFNDLWVNRKNYVTGFIDERFIGFYATSIGVNQMSDEMKGLSKMYIDKFEKIPEGRFKRYGNSAIIHNGSKSHKETIIEKCRELGILK